MENPWILALIIVGGVLTTSAWFLFEHLSKKSDDRVKIEAEKTKQAKLAKEKAVAELETAKLQGARTWPRGEAFDA